MKRVYLLMVCLLTALLVQAQVDSKYGKGAVPMLNGRVTFTQSVELPANISADVAYDKVVAWASERFTAPNVIKGKTIANEREAHRLVVNPEEYITFKRRFFVLDRTRINYLLEASVANQKLTLTMTRIGYWYEEERDGGQHFTAEQWITDEESFNAAGTKFLRSTGKFRIGTINLFDSLVKEASESVK